MFVGPNVWHTGEISAQSKLGWVQASSGAYNAIEPSMPLQHRDLLPSLLFLPVTTLDEDGRPWASLLTAGGKSDFVSAGNSYSMTIKPTLTPGDYILSNLKNGKEVLNKHLISGLAVSLENRRRNKFGAYVSALSEGEEGAVEFNLRVNTALGNCPKYITIRELSARASTNPSVEYSNTSFGSTEALPDQVLDHIAKADSLYLATAYLAKDEEESHLGMNHRGGAPGWIRVDPDSRNTLYIPDFSGNRMMQSVGNMQHTPFAGVAIPDWQTGDILYLTGSTKQHFGKATEAKAIMRSVHAVTEFRVTGCIFVKNALPLQQSGPSDFSAYNPPVRLLNSETGSANTSDGSLSAAFTKFEALSKDLCAITFTLQAKDAARYERLCESYKPGQYAILDCSVFLDPGSQKYSHMARYKGGERELNDDGVRTWSIALWTPKDSLQVEMKIVIRTKAEGRVTPVLYQFGTAVNERNDGKFEDAAALSLPLHGITGHFNLPLQLKTQLYLAGGIGVTPFLAMIQGRRELDDIVLVLSCKKEEVEVFDALITEAMKSQQFQNVIVRYQVSGDIGDIKTTGTIINTRLSLASLQEIASISDREIYLCGSSAYQKSVLSVLKEAGLAVKQVKTESFLF